MLNAQNILLFPAALTWIPRLRLCSCLYILSMESHFVSLTQQAKIFHLRHSEAVTDIPTPFTQVHRFSSCVRPCDLFLAAFRPVERTRRFPSDVRSSSSRRSDGKDLTLELARHMNDFPPGCSDAESSAPQCRFAHGF